MDRRHATINMTQSVVKSRARVSLGSEHQLTQLKGQSSADITTIEAREKPTMTLQEKLQAAEKLIVLSFNSSDKFIKRIALAKGWLEQQTSTQQYKVFWDNLDISHEV